MIRGLRTVAALALLAVVVPVAAVTLITETPRRHPLSVHKGRMYE